MVKTGSFYKVNEYLIVRKNTRIGKLRTNKFLEKLYRKQNKWRDLIDSFFYTMLKVIYKKTQL